MNADIEPSIGITTVAQQVLLVNHFKTIKLPNVKLLIADELAYVPFTATGEELLFEIFSWRYEHGATLVTSNLPFDEWTSVLDSERLTRTLFDRLAHHVHLLEINGESYRLANSKKQQQRHAKPNISSNKGGTNP